MIEFADRSRSYYHRGGSVPLIGTTLDMCFRDVVETHGAREAIVSVPQGRRLSYEALDEAVEVFARGLLAIGVDKGERVGIWSTDNLEWVIVQLATARIGAVLVNINPAYRATELAHALQRARVNYLILQAAFRTSDYVGMAAELLPELAREGPIESQRFPDLRAVIVFDEAHAESTERPSAGFLTWSDVTGRAGEVTSDQMKLRASQLDADDPINIQFTSGTTGRPKAVLLTHHNLVNNGYFVAEAMHFTEHDRLCVPVPFYHCFGLVVSNIACLTHGAAIVIPSPHFEAGATLRAIEDERCTALHGVPTMFVAELEELRKQPYVVTTLRTGIMAGAPCPPELVRRVMDELSCRQILIGYGQTEASPVTHCTLPEDPYERRLETVGINLPHQEVKLVDPTTGHVVAVGEKGEICLRGYHVMRGYFEDEKATRSAIDEAGWLHSGDLGVMDEHGYLQITGRLKDLIIRGGENIYPAEIEAFYYQHPSVDEIAVFGVPDERMGEEVGAWVRLRSDKELTPESLREFARDRMAHYKIPKHIWFVEEFPMTVTGKIQKHRIRQMVVEEFEQRRASGKGS